jgi:hypothetical protein
MGIKKDMYLHQIHKNKFVTRLKLAPIYGHKKRYVSTSDTQK